MENKLEIFKNPEFGEIRTITDENNEPLFIGSDIAKVLGFRDGYTALRCVDEEDTQSMCMLTSGGKQEVKCVNESGLYQLILKSTKPYSKKFKRWVTSEVLPSLRKHGGYLVGQENMSSEELLSRALLFANSKIIELDNKVKSQDIELESKQATINKQQPKVIAYDTVAQSPNTFTMLDTAKLVGKKDFGRTKLFEFLRQINVLCKNNTPAQKYINSGYFEVAMSVFKDPQGKSHPKAVTFTTYRGVAFVINAMFKHGLITYTEKHDAINNLNKQQ